jgi:hypothetical protein
MLKMELVPLELSDVVSEVMDDSSAVDAVFMDYWQVFMSGLRESGLIYNPPQESKYGRSFPKGS